MKKLIIILCLAPLLAGAQSVKYKILDNDLNKINNLTLYFTPISIEGWTGANSDSWFGYQAGINYRLGKMGSIMLKYRPQFNLGAEDISGNSPNEFSYINAFVTLNIANTILTGDRIQLSSRQNGNTVTTTYANIDDAKFFKMAEARLGFQTYKNILAYKIKGEYDPIYDLSVSSTIASIGLQAGSIKRLKIETDRYGKKKSLKQTIYYWDFLYAMSMRVDESNIATITATEGAAPDINKSRFGFQIGVDWIGLSNVGYTLGLIGGWRPTVIPEKDGAWSRFFLGFSGSFPVVSVRTPGVPFD